jgi:hypothetical protein
LPLKSRYKTRPQKQKIDSIVYCRLQNVKKRPPILGGRWPLMRRPFPGVFSPAHGQMALFVQKEKKNDLDQITYPQSDVLKNAVAGIAAGYEQVKKQAAQYPQKHRKKNFQIIHDPDAPDNRRGNNRDRYPIPKRQKTGVCQGVRLKKPNLDQYEQRPLQQGIKIKFF